MRKKKAAPSKIRKDISYKGKGVKKAKKKAVVRKSSVVKTRNCETWTESMYFQKVRQALRNGFRYWKPIMKALEAASHPYAGPNKRLKKVYECNHCNDLFPRTQVQVDHVEECGSLNCYEDIVTFLIKLTREEPEAYQVLCKPCHKIKTDKYKQYKKAA